MFAFPSCLPSDFFNLRVSTLHYSLWISRIRNKECFCEIEDIFAPETRCLLPNPNIERNHTNGRSMLTYVAGHRWKRKPSQTVPCPSIQSGFSKRRRESTVSPFSNYCHLLAFQPVSKRKQTLSDSNSSIFPFPGVKVFLVYDSSLLLFHDALGFVEVPMISSFNLLPSDHIRNSAISAHLSPRTIFLHLDSANKFQ